MVEGELMTSDLVGAIQHTTPALFYRPQEGCCSDEAMARDNREDTWTILYPERIAGVWKKRGPELIP